MEIRFPLQATVRVVSRSGGLLPDPFQEDGGGGGGGKKKSDVPSRPRLETPQVEEIAFMVCRIPRLGEKQSGFYGVSRRALLLFFAACLVRACVRACVLGMRGAVFFFGGA